MPVPTDGFAAGQIRYDIFVALDPITQLWQYSFTVPATSGPWGDASEMFDAVAETIKNNLLAYSPEATIWRIDKNYSLAQRADPGEWQPVTTEA